MLPHRTMQSHSLVPPHHMSLRGRGGESCPLYTSLVRESARVHFKELRNGSPVTETQKELVPDPSPRKTKQTVDRGLTPAYKKKGEGGGDCLTAKGEVHGHMEASATRRSFQQVGGWGACVSCRPKVGHLGQQGTQEFLFSFFK